MRAVVFSTRAAEWRGRGFLSWKSVSNPVSCSVTRVIRNRAGLYLKSDDSWTVYFREARTFESIDSAVELKKGLGLQQVEMVFVMGNSPSPRDRIFQIPDLG